MPGTNLRRTVGMIALLGSLLSCVAAAREKPGEPKDLGLPKLVLLSPGTAVDGELPGGWTDRVIRSVPRLGSGAVGTLPDSAKSSATLFRTVVLAQVTGKPGSYRLRSIGIANAVPFRGRDIAVTPDGPAVVRGSLSAVERIVANAAYDELARARIVARTPTFAVLRTPARLVLNGRHADVDLYYAVLTDTATGAVTTLNWVTHVGEATLPRRISQLAGDQLFDCALDVAVSRKFGPVNVSWSFAMASLPPGRTIEITPAAAGAAESSLAGRTDGKELEAALRNLLAGTGAPRTPERPVSASP